MCIVQLTKRTKIGILKNGIKKTLNQSKKSQEKKKTVKSKTNRNEIKMVGKDLNKSILIANVKRLHLPFKRHWLSDRNTTGMTSTGHCTGGLNTDSHTKTIN